MLRVDRDQENPMEIPRCSFKMLIVRPALIDHMWAWKFHTQPGSKMILWQVHRSQSEKYCHPPMYKEDNSKVQVMSPQPEGRCSNDTCTTENGVVSKSHI